MTPFDLQSAEFGEIVIVRYPFTNLTASKRRPAVIVSKRSYNAIRPDVVIMPVTSQRDTATSVGNVLIQEWEAANLLKPSAVKPIFTTLVQGLILGSLGRLQEVDKSALQQAIDSFLGMTP